MNFAESKGIFTKDPNLQKLNFVREKIKALVESYKNMPDEFFKEQTVLFQNRLEQGETFDDILPEAYATCYVAIQRKLGKSPYDVQIATSLVMSGHNIAEMKTGEGKTISGIMPTYLKALAKEGVHVMTANTYLAKENRDEVDPVFNYLGLTTGLIRDHDEQGRKITTDEKRKAYEADITYGDVREFGFNYLRNNLAISNDKKVLGSRNSAYAILDEVDDVLIDQATKPLKLSGGEKGLVYEAEDYYKANLAVQELEGYKLTEKELSNPATLKYRGLEYDYRIIDKRIELTHKGYTKLASIYKMSTDSVIANLDLLNLINNALNAKENIVKGVNYIVENGKIVLIDQNGRRTPNSHYSNGLHEAVEAKENLNLTGSSITLAETTYASFLENYKEVAAMTGTAMPVKDEFQEFFGLGVRRIPKRLEDRFKNLGTDVYQKETEKIDAIIMEILKCYNAKRPSLVICADVNLANKVAKRFQALLVGRPNKIAFNLLTAETNESKEADIIKNAGQPGAITIATNMVGRGVDIKLGKGCDIPPNPNKPDEAGLMIIEADYFKNERIEQQVDGRAARRGEPGNVKRIYSLEDECFKNMPKDQMAKLQSMGVKNKPYSKQVMEELINPRLEKYRKDIENLEYTQRKSLITNSKLEEPFKQNYYRFRQTILDSEMGTNDIDSILKLQTSKAVDDIVEQISSTNDYSPLNDIFDPEFVSKITSNELGIEQMKLVMNEYMNQKIDEISASTKLHRQASLLNITDGVWRDVLNSLPRLRPILQMKAGYSNQNFEMVYTDALVEVEQEASHDMNIELVRRLSNNQFLIPVKNTSKEKVA